MSESDDVNVVNKKWYARPTFDHFNEANHLYEIFAHHEDPAQYYPIANHLSKEVANHIVEQHNTWYAFYAIGDALNNFAKSMDKLKEDLEKSK